MDYKRIVKLKMKIKRQKVLIKELDRALVETQKDVDSYANVLAEKNRRILELTTLVKDAAEESSTTFVTNSFTENGVARIQQMIAELDLVLHGDTIARDQTPQEVWIGLLEEVRLLIGEGKHRASFEADLTSLLNYWGADNDLNTPDHIIANHVYRHLMDLKRMLEATAKWKGER